MSSRLIVKNLPLKADEDAVRKHFSDKFHLTDVRLMRTSAGASRRFAFVGLTSAENAEAAAKYFNGTFMNTTRIVVEVAKALGDQSLVSRRERKRALADAERETDPAKGEPQSKKSREDAKLREFLEVMRPQKDTAVWKNDNHGGLSQTSSASVEHSQEINEKSGLLAEENDEFIDMTGNGEQKADEEGTDEEEWNPAVAAKTGSESDGAGSKTSDDENEKKSASESDMDWLKRRQVRIKESGEKPEISKTSIPEQDPANKTATQEAPEALIEETGRLFLRNLAYTTREEEIRELMSPFGKVTEVHIPVDPRNDRSKGMAYIQFNSSPDAVAAWRELDGRSFQGRLLHVIGAQPKRGVHLDEFDIKNLPLKKQQLLKRKAQAAKAQFSWNSLYLNRDAVLETVAKRMGITKSQLLDPYSSNAAVKQALAESSVLEGVQSYFKSKNVDIAKFDRGYHEVTDKILLAKNLPFGTSSDELRDIFGQYGEVSRVLMPPDGGIAMIQFATAPAGRGAFAKLNFRRMGNSILYLQKAPKGVLDEFEGDADGEENKIDAKSEARKAVSARDLLLPDAHSAADDEPETRTSVFIKNLNFSTTPSALSRIFQALPGFLTCSIKTKPDTKHPGQTLSMGFGFAEFRTLSQAQTAVSALEGHLLDGHSLQLKLSTRGAENGKQSAPKQGSAKIIIKNLPFETTKQDVVELLGAFGKLRSVRLPKKFNRQTRGFAFAEFATAKEAEHAMTSLRGAHNLGRRLVMEYAEADAVDAETEIARAEAKVSGQISSEALHGVQGFETEH